MEEQIGNQEKADLSVRVLEAWVRRQTNEDFRKLIRGGQLQRSEISRQCGIGRVALRKNPSLVKAILNLEEDLRRRGLLPADGNAVM